MALLPPHSHTAAGKERRVGVEIEFGGLGPDEAARLIQGCFGGTCQQADLYRWTVTGTVLGDFEAEMDTRYVHKDGNAAGALLEEANRDLGRGIRKMIGMIAENLVPTEIVGPPVPFSALERLDALTKKLRDMQARDSSDNPLYAFGLHLNPEIVAPTADHLLPVLQAYLLLSPWLRRQIGVDVMRQILPHIDPFPESYVRHVLQPDYRPGMNQLIDDYLAENATRNRELDMLPCFSEIDPKRVAQRIDDPRIKPRPAFHYRLPEARINDPEWSIMNEWARWVLVETLASDPDTLQRLSTDYLEKRCGGGWPDHVARFLKDWRQGPSAQSRHDPSR